jgi:hypothetical protein
MPIKVDEAYLRHVIDILNNQISREVVASPGGPIEGSKILAGYAMPAGESLEGAVTTQGTGVHKILLDMGTLAANRASQLGGFIDLTGDAEDFATASAADFGNKLPGWVPGGKSDGKTA